MRKRGRPSKRTLDFSSPDLSTLSDQPISSTEELKNISYKEVDGKIAWDDMRDTQKENVKEFYARPDVQAVLEVPAEKKEDKPEFGDDEASALLDFLQPVLAIGSSKIFKVPHEITVQAYVFDDHMRKKLNPRMAKLLNKWGPSVFKAYKDEIGFGLVMLSCVSAQTKHMRILHDKSKRAKVTPISVPPEKKVEVAPETVAATGD
jgi:hypothetical protein